MSSGRTVAQNHKLALHPDSGPGRNSWHSQPSRQSNPFAEDMREARAISEKFLLDASGQVVESEVLTFGLDMVSAKKEIYWVLAGDPHAISSKMVQVVDELMAFEVKPSRYVVVSPGGPPASQALYGTQNCFDLSLKGAVQSGGEALVLAPLDGRDDLPDDVRGLAPGKRSKELFWDNLVRLISVPLDDARREIDQKFELYMWKTDRVLRLLNGQKVGIWLYSQLDSSVLEPGGFQVASDIQTWIDERVERNDGLFTVINDGNKLCVTPES